MYGPVCGAGGGATATPVGGGPTATPTPTRTPGPTPIPTSTPIPGGQLVNGGFFRPQRRLEQILGQGLRHCHHGNLPRRLVAGLARRRQQQDRRDQPELHRAQHRRDVALLVSHQLVDSRLRPRLFTPTRPRSGHTTCARARHRQPGRRDRSAWLLTRADYHSPLPRHHHSSLVSSFYIDDVSVSAALQGVTDPNGMDGEQLTKPEPKPASPLGVTEER